MDVTNTGTKPSEAFKAKIQARNSPGTVEQQQQLRASDLAAMAAMEAGGYGKSSGGGIGHSKASSPYGDKGLGDKDAVREQVSEQISDEGALKP